MLTAAGALTVTRDPATGLVTGTTLGDVTTTMAYNGFGEPESASASFDGTPLYQVSYTRDQLGRITDKVETIQGVTTTWTYRYDLAGRLEEVDQNAVLYAAYGFDTNGNRTGYSGFWGTTTGVYDAQDRMTSYAGATYTYTANGELLTKTVGADVTTYNYDVFGSLRAATLPDGTEIEYVIDAQHRRIGKKIDGVLVQGLLYKDQLNPIAELDGSGAVVSRFVYGTRPHVPEYMVEAGVIYRIVSDHLGSVRLVVDVATGAVAQRIDYDEYGRILQDTNPGLQPFGFAGGIWDQHVELVRFGWRDYDPESGRWTAKDPIGARRAGENLYDYVGSMPTGLIDPNGLWPKKTDKGRGRGGDDFWKWTHEDDKAPGDPDYGEEEIEDLIDIWEEEGRPDPKKRKPKRGRVREIQACEVSPAQLAESLPIASPESIEASSPADLGPVLVAAGAAIIIGTIVEDLVTGGVGIWNDPVMIQMGGALVMKGLQ